MIVTKHDIPYTYGQTIKIRPIFDVHAGNRHADLTKFKKDMGECDTETLFFGGGDLLDCVIASDLKRYRKSSDGTEGDDIIDEQIEQMADILMPYKDRIIGLGSGNHEETITSRCGTNPAKRLCKMLDTKFLGFSGLIRLQFRTKDGGGRSVIIRYHHGWGGGSRTQGADLTKFSRDLSYWDADVFCYGHVHRRQDDRVPRLGLSGGSLISRPKVLCICGTYLKTYSADENPTYSEIKGYPPIEVGGLTVHIKPNGKWCDISVVS
jgi:hypothetical protein